MPWSIDQFDYSYPLTAIAHEPVSPRDHSKLLILNRQTGQVKHQHFYELPALLKPGDVLVRNNSKVIPARLIATKLTGGKVEVLLVKQLSQTANTTTWECLSKPGLKAGQTILFAGSAMTATCVQNNEFTRNLTFTLQKKTFFEEIDHIGQVPTPPYIHWQTSETNLKEVYQTTFAKHQGSVAAPTAGLHFTPELDQQLQARGVQVEEVTLHVGLGTFLPVRAEQIEKQLLHQEVFELTAATAQRLNEAKRAGRRIVAVGTTTTRVLESCAKNGHLEPRSGETQLFIQPGFQFQIVDALITNFHLPRTSLLMLVSAFVSEPNTTLPFTSFEKSSIGQAYQTALAHHYRLFSFGDAMMIE